MLFTDEELREDFLRIDVVELRLLELRQSVPPVGQDRDEGCEEQAVVSSE